MKGYPGVSKFVMRYKAVGHWRQTKRRRDRIYTYYKARVMIDGRAKFLGHFKTPQEAAAAYQRARSQQS